jgi:hypothetical protein
MHTVWVKVKNTFIPLSREEESIGGEPRPKRDTSETPKHIQQSRRQLRNPRNGRQVAEAEGTRLAAPTDGKLETDISTDPKTEEPVRNLQLDVVRYEAKINELENVIEQLKNQFSESNSRFERGYEELQRQLRQSSLIHQHVVMEYTNSKEECENLSNQNLGLLEYIAATRNPQPVHTDNEYTGRIQYLDETTKSWIASLLRSRQSQDHEFGRSITQQVLDIKQMNSHMRLFSSLATERPDIFPQILQNRRRWNSLIRQLIWAELSESIFYPFCFGLRDDISALLSSIMDTIYTKGI